MAAPMSVEERFKLIDEALTRKKMIADGLPLAPFTAAENMKIYDCVYTLCTETEDYSSQLYYKYVNCLEERIKEKVLPPLMEKYGETLLSEVVLMWSDLQAFAKSIYMPFCYLDRYLVLRNGLISTRDAPIIFFCQMVCDQLYSKLQEAALKLLHEEREGKEIDRNLLKRFFCFLDEVGRDGTEKYYDKFEHVMLEETAAYYSQLSQEWRFSHDSQTDFLQKIDWCLAHEKCRVEVYPRQTTKINLLNVIKHTLIDSYQERRTQNGEPEDFGAEISDILFKYASLSLDVGPCDASTPFASDDVYSFGRFEK